MRNYILRIYFGPTLFQRFSSSTTVKWGATAHPDNGGKALFFQSLGFRPEEWQVLADAFRKLAQTGEVSKSMESPHGCKYILDGYIETPSGRTSMVRIIWIVDRGVNTPRLVTAYPHSE
jgi:hypothetical protein